jgi:hypothetical protein
VSSLTRELNPTSPIGRYLRQRFPNLRDLQRRYLEPLAGATPLAPAGARVAYPYGTVGTAFDWQVRLLLNPAPDLTLAFYGAFNLGKPALRLLGELAAEVSGHVRLSGSPGPIGASMALPDAPSPAGPLDAERLARMCYVLALYTESFRAGLLPGSRLLTLRPEATLAEALDLAADGEVADLLALAEAARRALLPALAARGAPLHVGPTFAGSAELPADADVIAGGLLVELKTTLGDRRADGTRRCSLAQQTVHELLGYLLLDYDDAYRIDALGVYAARYAHLAVWPLAELLAELAGGPVDLAELRAEFRMVVQAVAGSGPPHTSGARPGRAAG